MATLSGHTQEVCGLKWSLDGRYLASGGNDNLVNIWPATQGDSGDYAPVQTFTQHQGAVKVSVVLLRVGRVSAQSGCAALAVPLPGGREAAVCRGCCGAVVAWALGCAAREQAASCASYNEPFLSQAVAWCPWQSNVLATGGGTSDRHIRIWNVCSGTCLSAVDAHSQVRHRHQLGDKFLLAGPLHVLARFPGQGEPSGAHPLVVSFGTSGLELTCTSASS